MTRWNPGAPDVAGDEWPGAAAVPVPIAGSVGRGPVITARSTQSVTDLAALVRRTSGSGLVPTNGRVDVYDLANPVGPDTQTLIMALPVANAGVSAGGTFVKATGGVESGYDSTAWNLLDDVISNADALSIGNTTQVRYKGVNPATPAFVRYTADNTFYDGDDGHAIAGILTGKRILTVEVIVVAENVSGQGVRIDGELIIGGTVYTSDSGPLVIPGSPVALTRKAFVFAGNPATNLPWTEADAVALTDGTDDFGIEVITKTAAGPLTITAACIRFRVCTERRVATGHASMVVNEAWMLFPLLDPADDTSQVWAKVSGHQYLFLYSLTADSASAELSQITTASVAGVPDQVLTDASVQGWTLDKGKVPLSQDDTSEGQIATLMYVAGAVSLDSLPYGNVLDIAAGSSVVRKQIISTHSSQDYGTAMLLVSRGAGGQDAGLAITLKRNSDNVVLAGPTTIPVADIPADGKYHIVQVLFAAPATLVAGVAVRLEAVSTGAVPWLLPALETRLPTMGAADPTAIDAATASIGGATDRGDGSAIRDYPWSIIVSPDAPTGLSATMLTLANQPDLAGGGIGTIVAQPVAIQYAHLGWTATSLGASHGYYEIQRRDDGVWNTIAVNRLQASNFLNDVEGPRGIAGAIVARSYRLRVVSIDGGISAWVNFPSVNIGVGHCADVVCSSNFDPANSLAFRDLTNPQSWDQRQTSRGKIQDIEGRDFPVAFWPADRGGEAFARRLAVAFNDPAVVPGGAVTPGRAVFDPVLALLQDRTLPYVCFADSNGRVWLTSPAVQSPGPTREEPNGRYSVTVLFTQVEGTPGYVDNVGAPWAP